jgi:hypothetical protein
MLVKPVSTQPGELANMILAWASSGNLPEHRHPVNNAEPGGASNVK